MPGNPLPFPEPSLPNQPAQLTPKAFFPALFQDESSAEEDPIPVSPGPWVDTLDRSAVQALYQSHYVVDGGLESGWNGDQSSCNAGSTSAPFKEAILNRLNFFRSMSGVPALTGFSDEYNQKAQQAALMMRANSNLSHNPPSDWTCYTADGAEGAGSSNLYLGRYGFDSITGYMYDPGSGNYAVGHRRWILYPNTQRMGTGDIPSGSGGSASNALWVFDYDNIWGSRPDTRSAYVAWPPPGYVPRDLIFPRWSFSYPQADFSAAAAVVTRSGTPVGVTLSPVVNGFGDNTLVWELAESLPAGEVTYSVTVSNVVINGQAQTFTYEVTAFDASESE